MKKNNYGLPISYSGITYKSSNEIVFFDVIFEKDFGDFYEGEAVRELIYNIKKCTLVDNKQVIVNNKINILKKSVKLKIKCKK